MKCEECEFYEPEIFDENFEVIQEADCNHPESWFHSCPKEIDEAMAEDGA